MSGPGHGQVASHSGHRRLVDALLSAPLHAALLQALAPSAFLEKANLTFLNPESLRDRCGPGAPPGVDIPDWEAAAARSRV